MIPNVCMGWCQRQAICKWCEQPITVATPVVTVFYWNKGADGRKWNVQHCYHPQCWVDQGLDYLSMNPYVPAKQPKNDKLTQEQRRQRYLLLRKKAYLDQKKRRLVDEPDNGLEILTIDADIAELAVEIAQVGGIPSRWLSQILR